MSRLSGAAKQNWVSLGGGFEVGETPLGSLLPPLGLGETRLAAPLELDASNSPKEHRQIVIFREGVSLAQ